jgi:acetoin utilization protein AcuC
VTNLELKTAIVQSGEYEGWVFSSSHPTQGRRFTKAFELLTAELNTREHPYEVFETRLATPEEFGRVHSESYIREVLEGHVCNEWEGERADLSNLASKFVGGTLVALDCLINKDFRTAIHFPGAKHHAQHNYSSGFCVFNDFAIAADIASKDYGLKVAIYDFDGHHGDGTENLTIDNPNVLTLSVHEHGIFPGTGDESIPEKKVYNVPLFDKESVYDAGKGDDGLGKGFGQFVNLATNFEPDLIMIAAGADGHWKDPLTNLQYSEDEMILQGTLLRRFFPDTPILVGGAGGYQPDTFTPKIWAGYAANIATSLGWSSFK